MSLKVVLAGEKLGDLPKGRDRGLVELRAGFCARFTGLRREALPSWEVVAACILSR
jgi:hypothetical protein